MALRRGHSSPAARPAEATSYCSPAVCHQRTPAARPVHAVSRLFGEQATATLLGYRWPGNIRELKNVVGALGVSPATANMSWTRLLLTLSSVPRDHARKPFAAMSCPRRWMRDFRNQRENACYSGVYRQAKYRKAGGGAAGINLSAAPRAAEKACERRAAANSALTAIAPDKTALNHGAYWAAWAMPAVKTARK